jgi:sigma54-dependent transcription regulator
MFFSWHYASPMFAVWIYGDEYKTLVFKCDNVMRDHYVAKARLVNEPSEANVQGLKAAEVGLVTCHDYDHLRKRMQRFGLNDHDLSMLGIEAIEEKAEDVRAFVRTHEIRY